MLQINNLSVEINQKLILNNINYQFELGINYAILGQNGSGKSTLIGSIIGMHQYHITHGEILLDQQNITNLTLDIRAKLGIYLGMQNIPEIPGIKVFDFLKVIYNTHYLYHHPGNKALSYLKFKEFVIPIIEQVGLHKDILWRDLNVGFSGGEKKKLEIVEILLIKPKYIFLDEIDSGLDVDAIGHIGKILQFLINPHTSLIIISHNFKLLEFINISKILILENGIIIKEGKFTLIKQIQKNGFNF